MRKVFKLRLQGFRLGPTEMPHPLLTSVNCPFNLLRLFKEVLPRFLGKFVWPVFCLFCSKLLAVFHLLKYFFVSFFSSEYSATWHHGLLSALQSQRCPWCTVAGSGTNIPPPSNTTQKQARQKGKSSGCVTQTSENVHACVYSTRPAEAECCCIQRFLRYANTACFRVIEKCKKLCTLHVYTQTVIGVFFVHGNRDMHACLTQG